MNFNLPQMLFGAMALMFAILATAVARKLNHSGDGERNLLMYAIVLALLAIASRG